MMQTEKRDLQIQLDSKQKSLVCISLYIAVQLSSARYCDLLSDWQSTSDMMGMRILYLYEFGRNFGNIFVSGLGVPWQIEAGLS